MQIARAGRHQLTASLKMETLAAVDYCDDLNMHEAAGEELQQKKDAVEDAQRLNKLFVVFRHFGRWCPFLNMQTGVQRGENIQEAM